MPVIDILITLNSQPNDLSDILVKLKNLSPYLLMSLKNMADILFVRRSGNNREFTQ